MNEKETKPMTKLLLIIPFLAGCATLTSASGGANRCHGPVDSSYIIQNVAASVALGVGGGYAYTAGSAGSFRTRDMDGGDVAIGVSTGLFLAAEPFIIDASSGAWSCP